MAFAGSSEPENKSWQESWSYSSGDHVLLHWRSPCDDGLPLQPPETINLKIPQPLESPADSGARSVDMVHSLQIQLDRLAGQLTAHAHRSATVDDMTLLEHRIRLLEEKLTNGVNDNRSYMPSPNVQYQNPRDTSTPSFDVDRGSTLKELGSMRERSTITDTKLAAISTSKSSTASKSSTLRAVSEATSHGVYMFNPTVWDAALTIGLSIFTRTASFMTSFALLLAVSIQVAFCYIIYRNLGRSPYDSKMLYALYKWRLFVAHDVRYADPVTHASLASRVCNKDPGLELATDQLTLVDTIEKFGEGQGPVLALLMIFVFALAPLSDVRTLLNQIRAFWNLAKRNQGTIIIQEGDQVAFAALSFKRLLFYLLLAVLRCFVNFFYLVAGCLYLAYTPSITSLLLGGAALAFVLEIDERVYGVLVPMSVRYVIEKLRPLRVRHALWQANVDPEVCCSYVVTALICVGCLAFFMMPTVAIQTDVHKIACGGDINFVYAISNGDRSVNYAPSPAYIQESLKGGHGSYEVDSLFQRIGLPEELDYGAVANRLNTSLGRTRPQGFVSALAWQSISETVAKYQCMDCLDAALEYPPWKHLYEMWRQALSSFVGMSISTCADVRPLCQDPLMVPVRAVCPLTCGCHNLTSSLFFSKADFGCPPSCQLHPTYVQHVENAPCRDMTLDSPQMRDTWQSYWSQYVSQVDTEDDAESGKTLRNLAIQQGCSIVFFMKSTGLDSCDHVAQSFQGRSLRAMCPVTCGCDKEVQDPCPQSCANLKSNDDAENLVDSTERPVACEGFEDSEDEIDCDMGVVIMEGVSSTCCTGMLGSRMDVFSGRAVPHDILRLMCCSQGCIDILFASTVVANFLLTSGYTKDNFCLVSSSGVSAAGEPNPAAVVSNFDSVGLVGTPINCDGFEGSKDKTVCDVGALVVENMSTTCCDGFTLVVLHLLGGLSVPGNVMRIVCCSQGCVEGAYANETVADFLLDFGRRKADFCLESDSNVSHVSSKL